MIKERGYIENFSDEMLLMYGLNEQDKEDISILVKKAISENLYTDTKDYHHNLKHVERVIAYVKMIINQMDKSLINERMLLYAALYHDIGKTKGASNQDYGLVGAAEFKKMTRGQLNEKEIEIISLLIYQHASEFDVINFENTDFSETEKLSIQFMADILKDADALDRNRLNYPPPLGTCDINELRTKEALEVYPKTDLFYQDYCATIISEREKATGKKILDNYELLDQWISDFKNGKENLFHASLDPSIDVLLPNESTQKGKFVYAGIDPVNCFTMASFRSSTVFPRDRSLEDNNKRVILEIFPNSLEKVLGHKFITIYRVPNEQFHEYRAEATASPHREWVSSTAVEPIEQVSFKAMDLLKHVENQVLIEKRYDEAEQLKSYIKSFQMYIWGVKSIKDHPEIIQQKWELFQSTVWYYSQDIQILRKINTIRMDVDNEINTYIENFKLQYGREPNYDNESECVVPILKWFYRKYLVRNKDGKEVPNYESISELDLQNVEENHYDELVSSKKN